MYDYEVGKQVVCTSGGHWKDQYGYEQSGPIKGQVLTIRGIQPSIAYPGKLKLCFMEFNIICPHTGQDAYFLQTNFRPVRTTSIDVFTGILAGKPVEELV